MRLIFLLMALLFPLNSFAGTVHNNTCVAYTKLDKICVTVPEFESYYNKKYKPQVIQEKGKGNWYFDLADKILAAKDCMLEKLILHEADKTNIQNSPYFKKYLPNIKLQKSNIEHYVAKVLGSGKIDRKHASIVKTRLIVSLINSYKKKAYIEKTISNSTKVTTDDLGNFIAAHDKDYGFKLDPNNPKLKVINKRQLVKAIRAEKLRNAANRLTYKLFQKYQVRVNRKILKKLPN